MSTRKWSIIEWCGGNLVLYGTAIAGTVYNEHTWLNVFRFLIWIVVFTWVIVNLGQHVAKENGNPIDTTRHIPAPITFTSDLVLACIVAAYGHWFYAVLVMFQQYLEQMFFNDPIPERKA